MIKLSTIITTLLLPFLCAAVDFDFGHLQPEATLFPETTGSVTLDVQLHTPCNTRIPPFEKIRFPSHRHAPLREEPGRPGCYVFEGTVEVLADIEKDLELYVEIKHKAGNDVPPVRCRAFDNSTLQGGFGSCLYRQPCQYESARQSQKITESQFRLTRDGHSITCGERWRKGTYENVGLHFCMLSPEAIAAMTEHQLWNQAAKVAREHKDGDDGSNKITTPIYIKVYLFEKSIKRLFELQLRLEKMFLENHPNLDHNSEVWNRFVSKLPFHKYVRRADGYVGCHTIVGRIESEGYDGLIDMSKVDNKMPVQTN